MRVGKEKEEEGEEDEGEDEGRTRDVLRRWMESFDGDAFGGEDGFLFVDGDFKDTVVKFRGARRKVGGIGETDGPLCCAIRPFDAMVMRGLVFFFKCRLPLRF